MTAGLLLFLLLASGCASAPASPPLKGPSLFVTRALLEKGTREASLYGAYSYLLLPLPPRSDERYAALLSAYAALPQDGPYDGAEQRISKQERNLTYVPVDSPAAGKSSDAAWVIEHYDVGRAALALHSQQLTDRGPYIVTYHRPLLVERSRVAIAVLDLSHVSKESIPLWLDYYRRASQGPHEWRQRKAELLLLRLHDILSELGTGMTVTIKSMEPAGKVIEAFSLSH